MNRFPFGQSGQRTGRAAARRHAHRRTPGVCPGDDTRRGIIIPSGAAERGFVRHDKRRATRDSDLLHLCFARPVSNQNPGAIRGEKRRVRSFRPRQGLRPLLIEPSDV